MRTPSPTLLEFIQLGFDRADKEEEDRNSNDDEENINFDRADKMMMKVAEQYT